MDNISATSLDWALQHVERFGDTDIFPVPFEFNAIGATWTWLRGELVNRDLDTYSLGPFRRFTDGAAAKLMQFPGLRSVRFVGTGLSPTALGELRKKKDQVDWKSE